MVSNHNSAYATFTYALFFLRQPVNITTKSYDVSINIDREIDIKCNMLNSQNYTLLFEELREYLNQAQEWADLEYVYFPSNSIIRNYDISFYTYLFNTDFKTIVSDYSANIVLNDISIENFTTMRDLSHNKVISMKMDPHLLIQRRKLQWCNINFQMDCV